MAALNETAANKATDIAIKLERLNITFSESDVKALLASDDVRDKKKLNLIIKNVVEEGNTDALKLLVDNGYKADVLSRNLQTPLHVAFYNINSYKIDKDLVDLLFSCASDKNFQDSIGLTHLHVACVFGNVDMIKTFIKNKENVNACFRFQLTPLHFAVMHHRLEIVKLLVKNGAKVSAADHMGKTPLHLAARVIDDENKSYCKNDDLEILKFLLDHQFNIHIKDKDGNTPLLSIFEHFYADYEENLIWHHSADDSFVDSEDTGINYINARQIDKLTILLKAGANITTSNNVGDTILHRIITGTAFMRTPTDLRDVSFDDSQHVQMVNQILAVKQNFNINAKNKEGKTPLQVAVSCLSAKIVEILLNHKADISNLRFESFHYVMVPNLECVQNIITICELLSNKGFNMSILHELPILTYLIHNKENCNCTDLNQYFDIRDHLEVLIHFGSSAHIKYVFKRIFRKSVINSMYGMAPLLMDILQYLNYIECGNFFIEKKVHNTITKTLRKANFCMLPFEPENNEIEKMKGTTLKSSVTLYEIMQKNPNVIYKYIHNEDFKFINNFPQYQDIIRGHLTKALMRNYIEKTTYDYLKALIPYPLKRSCYKTIIKYLSNEDMVNIVTAIFNDLLEKFHQS